MKTIQLSLLFSIFFTGSLFAQTVTFSGTITDQESGETLPFANISFSSNGVLVSGGTSDFDGRYSVKLNPGVYTIEVSYVGLQTFRVENVPARKDIEIDFVFGEKPHLIGVIPNAQTTSSNNIAYIGSLQGVVEQEGKLISGAEIYIWEDKKAVKKVTTDPGGNYILSNLIPGFYDVFVSYPDGSESEWQHVYIPQRKILQLDFQN